MREPTKFTHSPYLPYARQAQEFKVEGWLGDTFAHALEYNGWEPEQVSWKKGAYICGVLNPNYAYRLTGTQVQEFMRSISVNSLRNFVPGTSRHIIMVGEDGYIMAHGMFLCETETSYVGYFLAPYLAYRLAQRSDLDVAGEWISDTTFVHQIGGPRSLEIVEDVAGENVHDVKFLRHRMVTVAGHRLRLLRIGMAGTLAYELHGPIEVAEEVFTALIEAGKAYDAELLGLTSYMSNHTEDGFPQSEYHFPNAWDAHPEFLEWMAQNLGFVWHGVNLEGSETDIKRRYRNPYDVGWGHMVKFDHDFIGRAALERVVSRHNEMRTLVWNADDIVDVYRSAFESGESYLQMDMPIHLLHKPGDPQQRLTVWADKVFVGDRQVGTSSGRTYTLWSKQMLSLATLEPETAKIGTEVTVLWGQPGTRQKKIRARVERFPFLIEPARNEVFDVNTIRSRFAARK